MRRIRLALLAVALFTAAPGSAHAQPAPTQSVCPYIAYGAVLTAAQWNYCFQIKQDNLGYVPLNSAGGTMTGPLITTPSTAISAGFSIPPGIAPTSPIDGNLWTTSAGLYVRINGSTVGPLVPGGGSPIFTSPVTINLNAVAPGSLPAALTGTGLRLAQADAVISRIEVDAFGTASPGVYSIVYGRGTGAAPTAVQSGDEIGSLNSWGYTGAGTKSATAVAAFRTFAAENFSSGHQGSYARIATTAIAGTTLTDRIGVENDGGITVGSTLGTSAGPNTLNLPAAGLYNNGTVPTGTGGGYVLATGPTISGASLSATAALGLRDTSAAFDLTIAATSSPALTAGHKLTININNLDATLGIDGNVAFGGSFQTANTLSLPAVAQGDLWYGSATGVISALAKSTGTSNFLKNSGTSNNPAWAQPAASDLSNGTTGTGGGVVLATGPTISSLTVTTALTATGLVTTADIATQAANTFLANVTSGTASPTAATLPSCTGAAAALQYTNGTGLSCGTITAAASSITYGTTTAGTSTGIPWNATNGGTLAAIALVANAVLVTNATPTPSFATTLPSGLTIPSPTVSGTVAGNVTVSGNNTYSGTSNFTSNVTVTSASFGLTGNISAAAWGTSAIRYSNAAATFTDTTSSGTVATAYTDVWGAGTIAASSAATFTNYFGSYFKDPVAGTNVTLTNKWALGADSFKVGTSNQATITSAGLATFPGTLNASGTFQIGGVSVNTAASTTQYAAVKIDNVTIQVNGSGQLNAVGASATSVTIGTTTISSGTNARLLYDNSAVLGEVALASGNGISLSGTANATIAVSLSTASNCIGADVTVANGSYTDGPSMAQGTSGTWDVTAVISFIDSNATANNLACKLWDATTEVSSTSSIRPVAGGYMSMTLKGTLASPAANLRVSCKALNTTTTLKKLDSDGNANATCIWGKRIS